jgi:glutamate synthase (NADPH/NADH) small chain
MPKQKPEERIKNFKEVALGYTEELARQEAARCLQCKTHPCVSGCPVNNNIPGFIKAIREGNMVEAVKILKRTTALPGICSRVCPQEKQCEGACTLGKRNAPIAIGALERYVADWARAHPDMVPKDEIAPPTGKKVAVVGSGPAGLTCAADLAKMGHRVTIFDALHYAGGVLRYGIPEFRLPKDIVQAEVDYVASLGVEIRLDTVIGRIATVDELLQKYDAVFLGIGAGLPMFLNIPGENLNGIYSANEFLTRINLMKAHLFPEYDTPIKRGKRAAIIGGGNVAMDAATCARRIGYEEVYVVYRRSKNEMPARKAEVEEAEEEGIIFKFLTNPKRFIGDENGWVRAMECYEMMLGEPDASGRPKPVPKPNSEFIMEIDTVIVAPGTRPNPLVSMTTPGLETTNQGMVVADIHTGKTKKDRVWAGGDIVTGPATVVSAMGAGKRAAKSIDEFLRDH